MNALPKFIASIAALIASLSLALIAVTVSKGITVDHSVGQKIELTYHRAGDPSR